MLDIGINFVLKKPMAVTFNGRGCYDYAKRDVNPDDKNKGYWRSLK